MGLCACAMAENLKSVIWILCVVLSFLCSEKSIKEVSRVKIDKRVHIV